MIQTIFEKDRYIFESDGIDVTEVPFPDNTLVVRTIDNRTNGLFLLSEEKLRLKGSTDQKLAQYFYAQHSSNKSFFAAKSEQKNSEFILQHYNGNVKYEINGFLARNRGDPSPEIITCLKSSSIQFVREELAFHCEKSSGGGSRLSISSSPPENTMDTSHPPPSPQKNPNLEKRPSLIKSRSAAFIPDPERSPARGLSRASSMITRNGSLRGQGKSLTQLTASYTNEIITETNTSEARYSLCLKLNNSFDPTTFDPLVLAQQLRPYSVLEIISFDQNLFPHRLNLVDFVDTFTPVTLVTIRDGQLLKSYLQDLMTTRRCGQDGEDDQRLRLCQKLQKLIPDLPELDSDCRILRTRDPQAKGTVFEEVLNGIRVTQRHVYLSGLSFYYLTGALRLALKLIALRVRDFYNQRRFSDDQKVAGVKIGMLMKKFLVRRKEQKQSMKLATIVIAQVALKRMRDAKKAKEAEVASANAEDNSKMMDAIEIDVPSQAFPLPPSEPTHTPRPDLPPESTSSSNPDPQVIASSDDTSRVVSNPTEASVREGSYEEQQELIRSLREENISLKRQLVNLSTMLAEASRPQPTPTPISRNQSQPRVQSSVRCVSSVQTSPPYNPARKVLKTQSSSLETFSLDCVYGGDISRDLEPTVTELKPEYEVFVERTLKTLKEDISYILARECSSPILHSLLSIP
jgi:hypothetical protein